MVCTLNIVQLKSFSTLLVLAYEVNIANEVEGMEHNISEQTVVCISTLLSFFQDHPDILKIYKLYRNGIVELF